MTTTPPPDTKVQSETLEQIANRIATDEVLLSRRRQDLYFEILSALRNERARAAKLADEFARRLRTVGPHSVAAGVEVLASEIRSGKDGNKDADWQRHRSVGEKA